MSNLTEEEIFERYPIIFQEKDLPMQQTCMCWGLEVPESWLPIIDELCRKAQEYTDTVKDAPQLIAQQVKSKFETLCFYYRLEPTEASREDYEFFSELVDEAEVKVAELVMEQKEL